MKGIKKTEQSFAPFFYAVMFFLCRDG
ncbi:hypothetical protein PBAL39_25465 [Pedobacter sp. BAL39]|nr:hypothetical protein PBAL39_25465 [Pedobacter sp. BAL39]